MNNNQIDLGKIYGINEPEGMVYTGVVNPNIPSLEQIARYNLARSELEAQQSLARENKELNEELLDRLASERIALNRIPSQSSATSTLSRPSADSLNADGTFRSNTDMDLGTSAPPIYGVNTNISTPVTTRNEQILEQSQNAMQNGSNTNQLLQNSTNENIMSYSSSYPVTPESIQYLNGFLRTQIGRRVEIEFLVGADTRDIKIGILLGVGANYILLNETESDDITACDFYNVKFVRIFY